VTGTLSFSWERRPRVFCRNTQYYYYRIMQKRNLMWKFKLSVWQLSR